MPAALSLADLDACDPRHPRRAGETDCCCPLCGPTMGKKADAAHRCFSYNRQTGAWHCHRCGESGILTDFREEKPMQTQQTYTSRRERSRQDLAARFRLPDRSTSAASVPTSPGPAVESVDGLADASAADREQQEQRASRWTSLMQTLRPLDGTPGAAYLEGRGLPIAFCHAAEVRYSPDWFGSPAVVFPLRAAPLLPTGSGRSAGKLIAAQGRATGDTKGKINKRTFNRYEGSMGVFATPGAWEEKTLTIAEAPIDALSLALAGVPALALCGKELGANRSTWLLPRFYGRHVLLAFDADDAGDAACVKIAAELRSVGALSVRRLRPEGEKDWNAVLLTVGAEALGAQLAALLVDQAAVAAAEEAELLALGAELEAEWEAQAAAESAAEATGPGDLFGDGDESEFGTIPAPAAPRPGTFGDLLADHEARKRSRANG